MSQAKGTMLVLLTALVSGFSIFLNSFAVQGLNPFAFTFLKNATVAVFLFSIILLLKDFRQLKQLSLRHWKQLATIGLLGGSIPFLLFFYALKLSSPLSAGFLHKSLFIFATVFALFFLKERISKSFIAAAVLLFAGNFLFFGPTSFGFPEALILIATVLWAAENVLSKHVLKELSGSVVAFGRMFFGSVFILAFLAFSNQLPSLAFSLPQLQWVLLASALLFLYVFTYYSGLKHLPLHKAAALLLLAQPITAILSFAFLGKVVSFNQAIGLALIVAGVLFATGFSLVWNAVGREGISLARSRH